MKISKMHFTNQNKRNMVLVTFTDDDGGHTTSSVFTLAGWEQLEAVFAAPEASGIEIKDES